MDIGSIFPIDDLFEYQEYVVDNNDCRIYYSLCREALFNIAKSVNIVNKTVMLPAYTCSTVIDPFVQSNWECIFYNINEDLSIDIDDLEKIYNKYNPGICVVHPFYGMDISTNERIAIKKIRNKSCLVIKDITQSIFLPDDDDFDFVIGSLRKWFPIPDGAFLINHSNINIDKVDNEFVDFCTIQTDSMFLRKKYFELNDEAIKTISIRFNKKAVELTNKPINVHCMSNFSLSKISNENINNHIKMRLYNFNCLHDNIIETDDIKFAIQDKNRIKSAPLYFPLYCEKRKELQLVLAQNHIYAPILWPINYQDVLINDSIKWIYDHILVIPLDQRYSETDMKKIYEIINLKGSN